MKVHVTSAQVPDLLRLLHAAGIVFVLLEASGPGWVAQFNSAPALDLTGYRVL